METSLMLLIVLVAAIGVLSLFFYFIPVALWISALAARVQVGIGELIGMRLRRVSPRLILGSQISATKAGLEIPTTFLEAHFLAGGHVRNVVTALIVADKAGITLTHERAAAIDLAGRDVLIVDDILDVGTTLLSIIDACKAQGAASVKTCVLVDKQHDRKAQPGLKADFTALEAADYYLFGMGMDYKGYWRNAPGIFAPQGM